MIVIEKSCELSFMPCGNKKTVLWQSLNKKIQEVLEPVYSEPGIWDIE